jgi:RNA polymerase sigma-70 factor (ECF subfamily)
MDWVVQHRSEFLAYLRKQGATPEQAEDLLQTALARGLEPWASLPNAESLIPWFYRVLRNAFIDHARRESAAGRALDRYAREVSDDDEAPRRVCMCTQKVLASLKPEYAVLITAIDLNGAPIEAAAREAGITPNNAYVRLHRARKALRERLEAMCGDCATGGCGDCYCQPV